MAKPIGRYLTENAYRRLRRAVLAYESNPIAEPSGRGDVATTTLRPTLRCVLLENLENNETATAAECVFEDGYTIQKVQLRGTCTGGTFSLAIADNANRLTGTTAAIAYNASAADMVSALIAAVPNLKRTDVWVSAFDDVATVGVWYVGFAGRFQGITNIELLTADAAELIGTATIETSRTTWRDSGNRLVVREGLGVGNPTPLVAGSAVYAIPIPRAGYCVAAVEARDYDWLGH